MKLFVPRCNMCGTKIYLNVKASSRSQLRQRFGGEFLFVTCPKCHYRNVFGVTNVYAEAEIQSAVAGGLIGGILGLIGGPAGLLIGGGMGALLGNSSDDDERRKTIFFNNSR